MSLALLDVNVLFALAWPSHAHHKLAHQWFDGPGQSGWATCSTTQCGLMRALTNPVVAKRAVTIENALEVLSHVVALAGHRFLQEDIGFEHADVPASRLRGHRQVTDAYLLGIAIRNSGRLVTFDRGLRDLLDPPLRETAVEVIGGTP